MIRKNLFSFLVLVWCVFNLPHEAVAIDKMILQLRWDHQFQFAGYYAAKWQGYYTDAGLEVDIRSAVNQDSIVSAVEEVNSGRADFGVGAADVLIARAQGNQLMIVAPIFQHSAAAFFSRPDTQISSPVDFTTLKVARIVNDLIDIELQALLLAEGIDPKNIEPYQHKPGLDHLLNREVDVVPGYIFSLPYQAESQGLSLNSIRPNQYGIDFYGDALFCHERLVQKDPELVKRFIQATLKGWMYALEHEIEIAKRITSELTRTAQIEDLEGFNNYQIEGVKRLTNFPEVEIGHINSDRWAVMAEKLYKIGILSRPLNVENFIFDPHRILHQREELWKRLLVFAVSFLVLLIVLTVTWLTVLRKALNRKVKEQEEYYEDLKTSEDRFRDLFENNPIACFLEDFSKVKTIYNDLRLQGVRDIRKYFKEHPETVGQCAQAIIILDVNRESLLLHKATDKYQLLENLQQTFTPESYSTFTEELAKLWDGELRGGGEGVIQTLDGEPRYVIMNFTVLPGHEKNLSRVLVSLHDITKEKFASQEKHELERRVQQAQKMEAVGTLAGGIAHDFNNLLAAILGFAELAKGEVAEDSVIANDLEEVISAGIRAKELVRQILAFSRQTASESIPYNPSPIVHEAMKMLRASIPTTIDFHHDIDKNCGMLFGDPTQFHQILMNLCTNAFHSLEETGGRIEVGLQRSFATEPQATTLEISEGDYIELIVRDNGPGILPEIQDRIFDPYFTTKDVGKGTGMGLAIIHGIVKEAGGAIFFDTTLSRGTKFTVLLPISEKEAAEIEEEKTEIHGNETILFVDDEDLLTKMGANMLSRLGYTVAVATSSKEALQLFVEDSTRFDLVITDQTMPSMTGSEMAQKMLQIRPGVPIILCTGYSSVITEKKAKELGIREFALKPLVQRDLALLVRKVLDEKQTEPHNAH